MVWRVSNQVRRSIKPRTQRERVRELQAAVNNSSGEQVSKQGWEILHRGEVGEGK